MNAEINSSTIKSAEANVVGVVVGEGKQISETIKLETVAKTFTASINTNAKGEVDLFCLCKQPSYGEMIGCDSDTVIK